MKAKKVNENKPGAERYRMTQGQFQIWFNGLYNNNEDFEWKSALSSLMNDEYSTDEEIKDYLSTHLDFPSWLAAELVDYRAYFWDFNYAQHIDI